MREGWAQESLDHACEVNYGERVIKKRDAGTLYPVYGGGGETFRIDRFNREDCTIVSRFGMSESCVRHVSGQFFLNDSGLSVHPRDPTRLRPRFLDYFLYASQDLIYSLGRGSAQRNLDVNAFRGISVSYPNKLSEQKRIVAILDEAFAGIDTAIANTEQNIANARALFESELNSRFSRTPDHWIDTTLHEVCSIKHGFAFKSEFFAKKGEHVVLTPGSFWEHGGFRDQGIKTKYYTGEIPAGYVLSRGDFLVAMTEQAAGLLGSALVVPESGRYLHNQRLGLVRPFESIPWNNDFFFHQFNTGSFRHAVQMTASGLKVRHTSPKKLGQIRIKYPPTEQEQAEVASNLNELKTEAERLERVFEQKLNALRILRQSLLKKAFDGQLAETRLESRAKEATA